MPELPDILLYLSAFEKFILDRTITGIQVKSPFVMRTFSPDISDCNGRRVTGFERLGKRIVWQLDGGHYIVFHLMIAGRFHWKSKPVAPRAKNDLVAFRFDAGTLMLTEASTKKRASIHVFDNEKSVEALRAPGLEVRDMSYDQFKSQIEKRNHTLKRCLSDPKIFSGIGNAYSDEILHCAKLSPIQWTSRLSDEQKQRLFEAIQKTISYWIEHLQQLQGGRFPEKVTAFRPDMAVHGRYQQPCPSCETSIQRIRYADRETNYCPRCQTDGKVLADRSLSRLLKEDWPKTIEELEEQQTD